VPKGGWAGGLCQLEVYALRVRLSP